MLRLDTFQFDRHLFAGSHVGPEVNVAKGPGSDFTTEAVLFAHA